MKTPRGSDKSIIWSSRVGGKNFHQFSSLGYCGLNIVAATSAQSMRAKFAFAPNGPVAIIHSAKQYPDMRIDNFPTAVPRLTIRCQLRPHNVHNLHVFTAVTNGTNLHAICLKCANANRNFMMLNCEFLYSLLDFSLLLLPSLYYERSKAVT